ncbi:MAG: hypothetical protein A4E28_00612 [Methanocella sp. PtaU1.Bin125]|nr:MAG: hypothetical protein A4E28_00612 [Methanocella sp. PtaU1.Bin125]
MVSTAVDESIRADSTLIAKDLVRKLLPREDPALCDVCIEELCDGSGGLANAGRKQGFIGEIACGLFVPVVCAIVVEVVKDRYITRPAAKDLGKLARGVYDAAIKNGLSEEEAISVSREFVESVKMRRMLNL